MTDDDHPFRSLKPLIALLLALADFAERASRRSTAFSALMIWILRPAEIAASAYADLQFDDCRSGDARADALQLAMRFRAIADAILYEAELAVYLASTGVDVMPRPTHMRDRSAALFLAFRPSRALCAPDTS